MSLQKGGIQNWHPKIAWQVALKVFWSKFCKSINLPLRKKVSVFGVILVLIFPHSDWIRRDTRIQSECGKMRTRIPPNTDTFYAVCKFIIICWSINFESSSTSIYTVNSRKLETDGTLSAILFILTLLYYCSFVFLT